MARTSKRPVTKTELKRAGLKAVHPEIVSKQELLAVLSPNGFSELKDAKTFLNNNGTKLTIADIQMVWNCISQALDHHDEAPELSELEKQCACIVTMAWDDEIALSDQAQTETV